MSCLPINFNSPQTQTAAPSQPMSADTVTKIFDEKIQTAPQKAEKNTTRKVTVKKEGYEEDFFWGCCLGLTLAALSTPSHCGYGYRRHYRPYRACHFGQPVYVCRPHRRWW